MIPLIQQGALHGLLAYAGAKVVGWCHAAPTQMIPALHDEPGATDEGVGNVVCFVVAPQWRRRGVARRLLDHACETLRQQGLTVAQAYPDLSGSLCARHMMTHRSLYAEQAQEVRGGPWRSRGGDSG